MRRAHGSTLPLTRAAHVDRPVLLSLAQLVPFLPGPVASVRRGARKLRRPVPPLLAGSAEEALKGLEALVQAGHLLRRLQVAPLLDAHHDYLLGATKQRLPQAFSRPPPEATAATCQAPCLDLRGSPWLLGYGQHYRHERLLLGEGQGSRMRRQRALPPRLQRRLGHSQRIGRPRERAACLPRVRDVAHGDRSELHLAMLTRGAPPPRGLYTRSTPLDERDLNGTGQAFAESFKELRRAAAVHRGALPRAVALASPGKAGKQIEKWDTQVRATTSLHFCCKAPRT